MKSIKDFGLYIIPVVAMLASSQTALSAVTLIDTGTLGGSASVAGAFLSGAGFSSLISSDGTAVAGFSTIAGDTEQHAFVWKNGVMTDLGTLGGTDSAAIALSSTGSVVVGTASTPSNANAHAFLWTGGVMTDLGTLGGDDSEAYRVTPDGSVVVGFADTASSETHAFRWENGVMTDLGTLGGSNSEAYSLSSDGSVVVGRARTAGGDDHAFRWAGGTMTDLGTLGGSSSFAIEVSADGTVVAGISSDVTDNFVRSFRWVGGVMTDIGDLGGGNTQLFTMSADGSTLGGYAENASSTAVPAFVWKNGTMTNIGTLGGTIAAVTSFSTDGTVAVGISSLTGEAAYALFRWTQTDGMQSLESLLTANSVDYSGWNFDLPNGLPIYVSADGTVITSTALYNGNPMAFLFHYDGASVALITPEELAKSIGPAAQSSAQTQSSFTTTVSQSLIATQQIFSSFFNASSGHWPKSAAAEQPSGIAAGSPALQEKAAYVIGSFGLGQNNDFGSYSGSGTTGMFLRVNPELAVGAGLLASGSHTKLRLNGRSNISSYGGALNLAYEGQNNWRFYGTAGISALNVSMHRNYINGASVDGSRGSTDGIGYGTALRGGYNIPLKRDYSIMPYLEVDASHTDLDGYTEHGGGAPATFGDQSADIVISRLGAEIRHPVTPRLEVRGRGAWGHEVSAHGDALTATALTVTTALPYSSGGDKDWLEGGVTGIWSLSHNISLMADLQAKAGKTSEPAIAATAGLTVGF